MAKPTSYSIGEPFSTKKMLNSFQNFIKTKLAKKSVKIAMLQACRYDDFDKVLALMETLPSLNWSVRISHKYRSWESPLIVAFDKKEVDLNFIHFLIEKGADPNFLLTEENHKRTALHYFQKTQGAFPETFEQLIPLFSSKSLNIQDGEGNTLLHSISILKFPNLRTHSIAQKLIDCGADLTLKNKSGETAEMAAPKGSRLRSLMAIAREKSNLQKSLPSPSTRSAKNFI